MHSFSLQVLAKDAELNRMESRRRSLYKDYCVLQDEIVQLKQRNEFLEQQFLEHDTSSPNNLHSRSSEGPSSVFVKTEVVDEEYHETAYQEPTSCEDLDSNGIHHYNNDGHDNFAVSHVNQNVQTSQHGREEGSIHSAILQEIERNFPLVQQSQPQSASHYSPDCSHIMETNVIKVEALSDDDDVIDQDVYEALRNTPTRKRAPATPSSVLAPMKSARRSRSPRKAKVEVDDASCSDAYETDLPHLRAVLNGSDKHVKPPSASLGVASSLLSALANQHDGPAIQEVRSLANAADAATSPSAANAKPMSALRAALMEPMPRKATPTNANCSILKRLVTAQSPPPPPLPSSSRSSHSTTDRLVELAIFRNLMDMPAADTTTGSSATDAPATSALRSVLEQYMTDRKTS